MRFCSQCGSRLLPNARFCGECGNSLTAETSGASSPVSARHPSQGPPIGPSNLTPFVVIFGALMVFGSLVVVLILRQLPARNALIAAAPPPSTTAAAEGNRLPADHPPVQLPKEALAFIFEIEGKARAHPNDLSAWNQLGEVSLRAAAFEPSYYATAAEAYAHVLKRDPDNLDALRGIGNVDFDQRKADAAVAAYEHYLAHKSDDPEVRTDLGTMLLSSGAGDAAIDQYKRVLESHPDFFEANFNLGVAYSNNNKPGAARTALDRALKLAPDDQARTRVTQMIATLSSATGGANLDASGSMPAGQASIAAQPAPTTFRGAIEQAMRDLPVAGDKVQSIHWDSATQARVLMDNFPMEQMPPFAAAKFIADLKAGVDQAKVAYHVTAPVQIDICDAAGGRVMQSVTE
jgi:tetratricopeptide (TPR) repeat protein